MKKITVVFAVISAFVMSSCSSRMMYDESVVIPEAKWDNKNIPYFDVNVEDTISVYSFALNARHIENYRYSNLFVFLHTTFPNGNVTHDTIECTLAYPDGSWVGRGSGSMRSDKILLNPNLRFPLGGVYHFEIEQAMRDEILKGIVDVGISIEKQ
ncbi:MAG: gliding motility lipoprotein GldH [Bacteroidales bacterium]|nr:gliding motility lipoprotein GldH [Bacteroidales bacterium]